MPRFRPRIEKPEDFGSGVLFTLLGLGTLYMALGYPMGTATRMGPGYLPSVLSGLLITLGVAITLRSLTLRPDESATPPQERRKRRLIHSLGVLRPLLFISLALVSFGLLLPRIGLFLAVIVMVLISAFADFENHLRVAIPLSVVLAIAVVLIFVQGLGIPIPVWPRW